MKTKSKYQKFMAVKGAEEAIFSSLHPTAMAFVRSSGKKLTNMDINTRTSIKRKKIAVAKTPFCLEAINEGINAWVNAPSAKIRLKRLGSLNTTKKMSEYPDAPRADAIRTSRPKPVTRENRMPKLFVNMDFSLMRVLLNVR